MFCRVMRVGVIVAAVVALAGSFRVANAESPSALLEKAIYTEETVGDLAAAAKLYEQTVTEATKTEAVAAEAQYRLGLCLLKQKKNDDATAAFKKLIETYPNQKDWVAKAKKHVPGEAELTLGEIPWKDGEFMQLAIKAGGSRFGALIWAIDAAKLDGKPICRMTLHRYVGDMGGTGVSHVDADPNDSRPIKSMIRNPILGSAEAQYLPGEVIVTTQDSKGKKSVHKEKLDKVYYDQEQACQILRRLPLAVGYKGSLPLYIPAGSTKLPIPFEVVAKETLDVPAGKFECYKVPLTSINQTLWYSTDEHHYLVQLEAPGAAIQLEQLGVAKPGETRTCKHDRLGCSFSVPAGWYFYETAPNDSPKGYFLLDPEELAVNFVGVWNKEKKDNDQPDGKKAVRAFAEQAVAARVRELKDYKVRPDSWREFTVNGLPAVSVIGDYVQVQHKKCDYSVQVMGKETRAQLRVSSCDPDKLDTMRAEFDKIVETLKIK
jgi:hypothetical protein